MSRRSECQKGEMKSRKPQKEQPKNTDAVSYAQPQKATRFEPDEETRVPTTRLLYPIQAKCYQQYQ